MSDDRLLFAALEPAIGQLSLNFFPLLSDSPRSLYESYLVPVSFSCLKWRMVTMVTGYHIT